MILTEKQASNEYKNANNNINKSVSQTLLVKIAIFKN